MTPSEKRYRARMERRLRRIELCVRLAAFSTLLIGVAAAVLLARAAEPATVEQKPGQVNAQEEARDFSPQEEKRATEPLNAENEAEEVADVYLGAFIVTHYCACEICCGKTDGITATGTVATEGRTVAVDPQVIPYGSKIAVYYPDGSLGHYVAEDCGGAIKGKRLDVYMDSHEAALAAGIINDAQVSIKQ